MNGAATPLAGAAALTLLLGSLVGVTWRQSRALEALEELDRVRRELALAEGEREELELRVVHLEGRTRVVSEARARLGMHVPHESENEIVHLHGEAP